MKKYYALGKYSKESFGGFIQNPEQDRKAVAEKIMSSIGTKLLSFDFLRGEYDFIASAESSKPCSRSAISSVLPVVVAK